MLLQLLLTLHLIGLVTMAGTTVVDYIVLKTLWKVPDLQTGILQFSGSFSTLIRIGAALLIITGFVMMIITHGVFGEMLWFRIKFAIVIILVINGIFGTIRHSRYIKGMITEQSFKYLNRFYIAQLTLFCIIIILSVFKFN